MKTKKQLFAIAIACCVNLVSVHAADSPGVVTPPPAPISIFDSIYQEAERAFLKSNNELALKKLNELFSRKQEEANARTAAKAHNLRGLIYFQLKNIPAAAEEFQRSVDTASKSLTPTDSVFNLAKYNLANALYQSAQVSAAAEAIESVDSQSLDGETRVRFFHLEGNIFSSREEIASAIIAYANAANIAKDPSQAQNYVQKIASISKKLYAKNPKNDLDKFVKASFELLPSLEGSWAIQALLARGYLYVGESAKAEGLLKNYLEKAPANHALRPRAEEMIQQMKKLADVDPETIGVLLPLSGKFAKFGRLCLNSMLMAQGAFENITADEKFSKIRFAIRDSGETAESAVDAFNKLVMEDHAIGVLGPLLSKQALPIAQKAQEYGVPLFSLSQKGNLDQIGSYVFPLALTPNQQVETIVRHATEVKNYKRFAIMAPDDNFGDEYVKIFWDTVEKAGAEIVAVERYEPKSTDFRDEIKRLLGLEFPEARKLEAEELSRREALFAATLKAKGLTRKRLLKAYELKPVVDFDAIFIPDDPQAIGQIAPSFAVRDVEDIPFLGINSWNTPEIVQRAGRYLQQSLFVDSFFPHSSNANVNQFSEQYFKNFGSTPGTIEVQAFDAAQIALHTLTSNEVKTRAKYRDMIVNTEKFKGISGEFQFTESGIKRSTYLLTVRGSNIVEVSPIQSVKK